MTWEKTTLGEIATVIGGGTPSTKNPSYWNGDVLWLTPTEVTRMEGRVIVTTDRTISQAGLANSSAKLLPVDTILLTTRATVGVAALAGAPMCTNQGFQSLIAGPSVLPKFLLFWVQQNKEEFTSRASGSTFPEISGRKVRAIPITLPPLEVQHRLVGLISSLDDASWGLMREVQALAALRSTLLSQSLEVEEFLPESLDDALGR